MRGSSAGISDGLVGSRLGAVLTWVDQALSAGVVTPLTVAYWRGTWCLAERLLPGAAGAAASLLLGLVLGCLLTWLQEGLAARLSGRLPAARLYTWLFGLACVNSWRGAWQLLDSLTGVRPLSVALISGATVLLLALSTTLRNVSAPPFAIAIDRSQGYFDVPTMFKTKKSDKWLFVLDCLFSVCVVGTLVVFVWRGSWTLLDLYLFPGEDRHQRIRSSFASLAIGYSIVLVSFASQPLAKAAVRRSSGLCRLLLVDLYLVFSFCGTINVWRGIWNSLNIFFLPEQVTLSCWISHAASFLLLVLINSSNSIMVRGVYIDAEEQGDQCVDFPCYYVRLFLQEKRKEKLLKKHLEAVRNGVEGEGLMEAGKKAEIVRKTSHNQPSQADFLEPALTDKNSLP